MSDSPLGYQAFWKRVARHVSLSTAAKELGVRASALTAFEKGQDHSLTDEQIRAYHAYLDAIPLPEPEVPEIVDEDEEPATG
jgi:transcriptional regulator with XRE-family HTH domain